MNLSFDEGESVLLDELDVSSHVVVPATEDDDRGDSLDPPIASSTPKGKHFTCGSCVYSTRFKSNLASHTRNVHGEKSTCDTCGKCFSAKYELQQHISTVDGSVQFLCEVCSKTFNSRQNMNRHMQFVHKQQYKYECNTCDKKFYDKTQYFGHLNVHVGNKPYSCKSCSKTYPYKSSLRKHEESCNGEKPDKYMCQVCQARQKSSASLKDHMQGMHGDSVKMCACGKTFKWRASFGRHVKKCRFPKSQ